MDNELVSIVIPVYNCAERIEKCLSSVIAQTYSNIEVIVIDDGSSDNSGSLCNAISEENNRITVYHNTNHGVSHARNEGIKQASGKYIAFIDADDTVDNDYIEILVHEAGIQKADLVDMTDKIDAEAKVSGYYYIENAILEGDVHVWGKLFSRDLIISKEITFPENITIGEDMLFLLNYSLYVGDTNTIKCIADNKYNYFINNEGAMNSNFKDSYMDEINCWNKAEIILFCKQNKLSPYAFSKLAAIQIMAALLVAGKIACNKAEIEEVNKLKYLNECSQMVKHSMKRNGAFADLSIGYKFKAILFQINRDCYLRMYGKWKDR